MKRLVLTVGGLALSLAGTGCATKKYVAKTVEPVEARVAAVESKNDAKNTDQDKSIAGQSKQIEDLDRDLSRTKESLQSTDRRVTEVANSARQAGERADAAKTSADGARTLAQQGIDKTNQLGRDMQNALESSNKYQKKQQTVVLFDFNKSSLNDEGKAQLDDFAKQVASLDRYMIEVQGFTDKMGSPEANETISQARAAAVTRYLVNERKIPVRTISAIGSGYTSPVGDDKTRDGRKENRRVEIRLFVPESSNLKLTAQQ
jgi:outer membrane protein OmpA-like peptidoglycan-associated protein